ncbi:hypothetical protein JFV29_12590 [Peribacillus sp. TH16]|uniref:ornithine cyclodeaminase family protein n=1 Tax=Peribacillus sp. TH16 TaxID=2798482 RepID=UPI0019127F88|nr:ornithine cyclodeaminase family protein [Peribacillus sp. TH16]MBK5482720.1 hypothetical protein [Peribacillus sp. TH16]
MEKVTFRYLSQEDVVKTAVPYEKVIELVETAMVSKGKNMVECPPKPGIHTRENTFLHAMPAFLIDQDICGMKWVCGYPENHKRNLPQIAGILVYNDEITGMPLSIMDCRWITAVRTAAVSAVTAKYCKPNKAETLSIIGAGVQGTIHTLMLKIVAAEIKKVCVYDVRQESINQFKEKITQKLDIEVVEANNPEEAARLGDILVTATQRVDKPIVKREWLKKGSLGIALEAGRAWEGSAILNADRYITDDWELAKSYEKQGAFPDGLPELHSTLGKIVIGEEPGRESANDIILAINEGMAISDIILAREIYNRALEYNIGIELPLMESENIF